jgi:hypothetical protein
MNFLLNDCARVAAQQSLRGATPCSDITRHPTTTA